MRSKLRDVVRGILHDSACRSRSCKLGCTGNLTRPELRGLTVVDQRLAASERDSPGHRDSSKLLGRLGRKRGRAGEL